jgi:hypothetical protein
MSKFVKNLSKPAAALLAFTLACAPLATPVMAQPTTADGITTQEAAASEAFPGLKGFLNLSASDRSQLGIYYVVRIKRADPAAVKITMTYNGQSQALRIAPDGRILPLPTREQLNGGARITISGPASGTYAMKIHVYSSQPNGRTYNASALATGIRQGNSAMSKIAGALALMVPKLDRVYFVGGGSGEAEFANGQKKALPRTTSAGEFPAGTPYFVPSDMSGAIRLHFSNTVSLAHYDNAPK